MFYDGLKQSCRQTQEYALTRQAFLISVKNSYWDTKKNNQAVVAKQELTQVPDFH